MGNRRVLAASALLACCAATYAHDAAAARPALIDAARACYLEAMWHEPDCVAVLYVAQKRAARVGRAWLDVLGDYSALNARNARAEEVRSFPWGDVQGKSDLFNRRWKRLRAVVIEFASGQLVDPCPKAVGWGGPMDKVRAGQVPVPCAVQTVNWFYAAAR